jgi:hypothetical protein
MSSKGCSDKAVALCGVEGRRWKHPTTGSTNIPAHLWFRGMTLDGLGDERWPRARAHRERIEGR